MAQQQPQPLIDVGDLFFQFQTVGDTLTGAYLGSQPIVWPDGNPGLQHFMDTGEGVYKFTGSFNLDNGLALVEPGAYTEIVYKGEQPTRRGLNPVKIFGVRTAQTRAIPVAAAPMQPALPLGQTQGHLAQQPYPAPQQQSPGRPYQVGGMPQHQAMPDRPRFPQQPVETPQPVQYLPDGTPIYGFTPDGTPLDLNGQIIAQAMQG